MALIEIDQKIKQAVLVLFVALNAPAYAQELFGLKADYTVGDSPRSIFSADLDGDGANDLAVANSGSDTVSLFLNNGDGTFADKVDYYVGHSPWSVFSADLDGDDDLAVTSNSGVSVLLNLSDHILVLDLTGDFDGDNEVGLSDFVFFLDVFGAPTSSADWNPTFDLDGNGEIGLSDFVIFLDNFGRTG